MIAKSAAGLAAAREKSGQADLLKLLTKSRISLERLAQEAEIARLDHLRLEAEAHAVWARHLPQEEREERRLKVWVFFEPYICGIVLSGITRLPLPSTMNVYFHA